MRSAAAWTKLMSVAIAGYSVVLFASLFGGGALAWLLALPGMFVGLQLIGLPLIMLCELAERVTILPRAWRSDVHELMVLAALIAIGWRCLPQQAMIWVAGFLCMMYFWRMLFRSHWRPGEPVELAP